MAMRIGVWSRRLALVLVAGAVLAYALWPRALSVDIGETRRGPLRVTVDEDGRTRVKERYVVSAPLGGQLSRIELRAGDRVTAGETVVALIEPTNPSLLDARAQAESEARVRSAEASRMQAAAQLAAAREALELAENTLERLRKLLSQSAIARQEFDDAEHEARIARETLRAAEFSEKVAEYELDVARSALVRTRPGGADVLERLELLSPIDGQVLRVVQESSAVVSPGQALLEVGDIRELELEIDVLSADAARIQPGAEVLLEHWGGDTPLEARVRRVEPSGFTKVSALGVEEQRVYVIADFLNPPPPQFTVGDGYRVEARIVVWHGEDVLQAPAGALFRDGDSWAVFAVAGGRAQLRHVEVGRNNGVTAELLGGCEVGDRLIVYPADSVRDGVRVAGKGG